MDNINELEELDLQEVSRKTHIEVKFLKYMINKDFDKLNRINTLGFVKILKREYDLDLSGWVEEFETYWRENRQSNTKESAASLLAQEQNPKKSSKWWVFILLLLLIGGGVYWYLNNQNYFSTTQEETANPPTKELEQPKPESVKEESTNQLEEPMESVNDVKVVEVNDSKTESPKLAVETNVSRETNETQLQDVNASDELNATNVTSEGMEDESSDEVYIQPKKRIWVGIVDLETRKKTQYTTKKVITIDLNKPQIIITGHGSFTLVFDSGKEETPNTKRTLYYYVDGGTITKINKKEFITYNGGRPW